MSQPPFPLIQGGNSPLYGRIIEQLVRRVDEEGEYIWVTDGCSPTTPTALVRDIVGTGVGAANFGYSTYDTTQSLPCVSRYTLDMSGWEIKTDLVTNKKYIDVYICLEDFHVIKGLSSGTYDGQTYWTTKSVQITGDRIIFYKSKGIDADQTSLFQSQLGTIYNRDLPGNSVNCKDPPPDWNPSYYMYRPDQPLVFVEDQEEFWKYQCGCVNYLRRDPSNPDPVGGERRYPSVITPIVVKDRLISLSNIINEQQHPILNYTSNTSAPESIILDTDCVINASCGSASQLISFDSYLSNSVSLPYNPMREIINSKNLDDFIQPKDSKLKALNFRVTEDDADFNSGTRIGNNTLTGPYIYFIILPNCGYKEWEDTSIDGVDYWGIFANPSYINNQGWGSRIDGGLGRGQFTLNIGCTPRAALPCNFTDQECDLCVRAAPSTWDYKNYDRRGNDCLDNPQPVYPTLDCNEGNFQWINDSGYATFPSFGDLLLGSENYYQLFQAECNGDEERDCHGNCFPKSWLNDNFCHNGKFRHPQRCKYFNDEGECELYYGSISAKTEIYSVPEIFLNCPRFENQTKNCSWNDNTAPICKGVCCEVYQGVFTGACTIKSRNECVLYDSISHPKAFAGNNLEIDNIGDWSGSDIKEEIWTLNTLRGEYSTIVGPSGELAAVRNNRNVAIDIEGGYFWEISPKDTIASPTTCSVCSKVKGLSTGCVYFGCCEEGSAGVSFCSPSPLLLYNYYYESSLYYQNFRQQINPNRSRPTNHGWSSATFGGNYSKTIDTTTWFNFDYSVVNYYNEVLLKTKSNGWWESIVQPVKQELPHTDRESQVSRIGPDYTQNNMGTRACCINGECSLKTISDCKEAGGFFHINLNVCDNIYCEPDRIGRCCETFEGVATGNCLLVTKTECEGVGGKNWVIDNLGNPIQCTNTYRGSLSGPTPAGTSFDLEVPILHGCIGNIPCVKMERDVRACCLEGGRCATLLISHCKNLGGTPDMLRYSCQQPHPLKESTPTDIKILNCAFAKDYPVPMSGGATPAHQKYWCDPDCIEPICAYNKTFTAGTITGEKCCDDWFSSIGGGDPGEPRRCDCILDELNLHKVCGNERGCGDTRGGLKYSGDCWTAHASPGCKSPSCSNFICYGELTSDTYTHCCINTWTEECAGLARVLCGNCSEIGCTEPNDTYNGCYAWQY